jgi:hypothetical protein
MEDWRQISHALTAAPVCHALDVITGLVPVISIRKRDTLLTGMAGTSPAMT